MFNLSEGHYNVVKQQARECTAAIKARIADGATYGEVAPSVISEYYQKVHTLLSLLQFVWLCGFLEGRFGTRQDYE